MPAVDPDYNRNWYQANKDAQAVYYSEYREKLRCEMIAAYGGRCQDCDEADPDVLVLDHVEDDAPTDRVLNNHNGGYRMYAFLKRSGWPSDGYRLLCHNCNFRKELRRRRCQVRARNSVVL